MSNTIYLGRDGQQMGPYAWAQIAAMASSGQVRPGDLAWHDGMAGWQPAERVLTRLGLSVEPSTAAAPPPRPMTAQAAPQKAAGGFGIKLMRLMPGKPAAKT